VSVLSARRLAIGWPGRFERVLASGIDLDAEEGKLAVLVGPNGAGKSTLLRTLVGLQAPLGGRVELLGEDISRFSVEERSRRAATVFTDRFDSGYFSVFEVVAFGRYPYTDARGRLGERDLAAVRGALEAVGLDALASRSFSELSDGERQKAQVARAIAQDCPLLVLDEPTAFLDAPARAELFHIARKLSRAARKAVVISTHDIEHALRFADRLWLLDGERRFRAGAPEDVVLSGGIGRAFDGEGFRFDARSGSFKSVESGSPRVVEISGREGASRTWTERLVERIGLAATAAGQATGKDGGSGGTGPVVARIAIEESEGGPIFAVTPISGGDARREGGVPREAASFEELGSILEELMREAEAE
jgi:iron complex transport system ATP-binding protein